MRWGLIAIIALKWICVLLVIGVKVGGLLVNEERQSVNRGYRIALHAQVIPTEHKVVGSVITTNGLKAALKKRFDVSLVEIFYPGQYKGYLEREWDFLVIEGWFLGLPEFIQVTRNRYTDIIIVFYCLDPTYPSLEDILDFDVDGIMTNSMLVKRQCDERGIPSIYLMLAADPDVMKPNTTIARKWNSVYVGAGGLMLQQKPALQNMLVDAKHFGLRLHGSGWDIVPLLREVWSGTLPQNDLSAAYASAEIVLASTIQSQDAAGMINNRVFEALSCGAVIMTCDHPETSTLARVFGSESAGFGLIDFYRDKSSFESLLDRIRTDSDYARRRREYARDYVLHRHTWHHRCIEVMNFLTYLKSIRSDQHLLIPRPNRRRLLWIESDGLKFHPDYTMILRPNLRTAWGKKFDVELLSQERWLTFFYSNCQKQESSFSSDGKSDRHIVNQQCYDFLSQYEAIFTVITPFDPLDQSIIQLSETSDISAIRTTRGTIQRRFAYMIGISESYFTEFCKLLSNRAVGSACQRYVHYDTLFHRTNYELDILREKFGVVVNDDNSAIETDKGSGAVYREKKTYRSQQLFAISSITRNITLPSIQYLSESSSSMHSSSTLYVSVSTIRKEVAFICFYLHRHNCRRSQRLIFAPKYPKFEEAPLILIGGSFEQWLDEGRIDQKSNNKDHVIGDDDRLENIIHIADQLMRFDDLILFLETVESVIVMTAGSLEERETDSTTTDVIFPFVAGAIMNRKIHLSHMNSHLIAIAQEGNCMGWDNVAPYNHWDRSIVHALDRIFGMPSRQSTIDVQTLQFMDPIGSTSGGNRLLKVGQSKSWQQTDEIKCMNCDPLRDKELLNSGYIEHLVKGKSSGIASGLPFAFLRVEYTNFVNGPDGQLCVNHIHGSVDDMMCLLRNMQYIVVTTKDSSKVRKDILTGDYLFDLIFSIRGNMFADLVWNRTISVRPSVKVVQHFPASNHHQFGSIKNKEFEQGLDKSFKGLIMDDIFMYNYPSISI